MLPIFALFETISQVIWFPVLQLCLLHCITKLSVCFKRMSVEFKTGVGVGERMEGIKLTLLELEVGDTFWCLLTSRVHICPTTQTHINNTAGRCAFSWIIKKKIFKKTEKIKGLCSELRFFHLGTITDIFGLGDFVFGMGASWALEVVWKHSYSLPIRCLSPSNYDNQKCPQALQNAPWDAQFPRHNWEPLL